MKPHLTTRSALPRPLQEAQDRAAFGFIQPDNGGPDAFVHISAVERAGLQELRENDKVSYELVADKRSGKQSADQLKVL